MKLEYTQVMIPGVTTLGMLTLLQHANTHASSFEVPSSGFTVGLVLKVSTILYFEIDFQLLDWGYSVIDGAVTTIASICCVASVTRLVITVHGLLPFQFLV